MASSMRSTSESTAANPVNLPNMIDPRLMGLERMRYIVRPSISRAMRPPASRSMTASPESSRNDRPKSIITRLFSHRANESSQSDSAIKMTERNMMSEKNRLRTISRNVLSAILNIVYGTL